jgi:beta-mannosidase
MQTLDLTGTWKLRSAKDKSAIPAQVPGDNLSALLAAGRVPDPHWADNETKVQWVGREDWVYQRTFQVTPAMLAEKSVFLNCDGLDTVATIFINGKRVAESDNMFTRLRPQVKRFLRPGANDIRIEIRSAAVTAQERQRKLRYPLPHVVYPVQSMYPNLVRKVPCHAGWDWGPCLMVSGINGRIYLGATSLGRIEYVNTVQTHARGSVQVEVETQVLSPAGGKTELEIELDGQVSRRTVNLETGSNLLHARMVVKNPKLWWPNGYGKQPLYTLTVRVAGDQLQKQIGLRTLEVVNQEDKQGLSMTFRINGVDIFCKGANWIPCDALPQRQTREVLDNLLTSATAANMNMLRVWGGGQYESEDFYDLCDQKGILIWQDFMFACSLYPATPAFLESVRQEARYQVRRIRDHACLALWCGNNENLGALGWTDQARAHRDQYLVDYDRLNEGAVGRAVAECDPTRIFWPSSPCGGPGDYSDTFHKDGRGDMHYWMVWHEGKSFDSYYDVTPRFCSEFGYQSFPSMDAIARYAPPDQFNVTAPIMEWHQRHSGGNSRITEMFSRYFRMPEGFANFVYLSQVQQALAIKTAVEHWRHLRPTCMGTLFWQINDNWPVCSWSSVEHGGKWKLLHYAAKKFYAPVLVSAFQRKDGTVEAWVTNDGLKPIRGTAVAEVREMGGKIVKSFRLPVRVPAGAARLVKKWKVSDLAPQPEKVFLELALGDAVNTHFFAEYKKCDLPQASIRTKVARDGDAYAVTLTTDKPAFFVALNAAGMKGEFDDNDITLLPAKPRTLRFVPQQSVTPAQFERALTVNHLRGTYA